MAFVLGKKRIHRFEVQPIGITLCLREFTDAERNEFEKEFRAIVNPPKGKRNDEAYDNLLREQAELLLVAWEGIEDEDGKAIALTDETKKAFFSDHETAKFWRSAVRGYLFPSVSASE